MKDPRVVLITGDDDALVTEAVRAAVTDALGDDDRALALEELVEDDYRDDDGFSVGRLIDAAGTPPFLTGRRVVVGRHLGRFGTLDLVAPLVDHLESLLETTRLVLVWEKGVTPPQQRLNAVPKSLSAAVAAARGEVRSVAVGRGKDADRWLTQRLDAADLRLDRSARSAITAQVGEDRSRVVGLIDTLEAVFGPGAEIGVEQVRPYLGEAGGVAPWELTDAIDAGEVTKAIDRLHRMLGAGQRHPLAVVAALHGHYGRLLRLDGADVVDERGAAEMLGIKGFPAKKALMVSRRMGSDKVARAVRLLAAADLDLRGRTAWPPELVAEVLVARLASLAR